MSPDMQIYSRPDFHARVCGGQGVLFFPDETPVVPQIWDEILDRVARGGYEIQFTDSGRVDFRRAKPRR